MMIKAEDAIRTFTKNNGGKPLFPILTIGRHSYVNDLNIQLTEGNETINIHIGNYCSIAYQVQMFVDRNHDYRSVSTSPILEVQRKLPKKGQILIGHDVWIGNNAVILSGVHIGHGAVIAANTVVTKDVPPYAIVGGNPMRVLKYRFDPEIVRELMEIAWWDWETDFIQRHKEWFGLPVEEFVSLARGQVQETRIDPVRFDAKKVTYLFYPDFDEAYPVWKNVVGQYMRRFTSDDDVTLLLRIENGMMFDSWLQQLDEFIQPLLHERSPDMLVVNDPVASEEAWFQRSSFWITNRKAYTLIHADYALRNGVRILSGVDDPIFP